MKITKLPFIMPKWANESTVNPGVKPDVLCDETLWYAGNGYQRVRNNVREDQVDTDFERAVDAAYTVVHD